MNVRNLLGRNKTILELLWKKNVLKGNGKQPQKFLIIARSRTGSTMLIEYLKKLPGSFVKGEMMGRKSGILCWKKIPKLFFENNLKYSLIGFKVFYYHPVDDYDANNLIYNYVLNHPDIKVIHWTREDMFAVILSRYLAGKTKAYSKQKRGSKLTNFTVDEMDFKYELEKTLTQETAIRNLFAEYKNYREFTYEDIVNRGRLNNVFDFLEVDGGGIEHQSKTSQHSKNKYHFITNLESLQNIYSKRMNNRKISN